MERLLSIFISISSVTTSYKKKKKKKIQLTILAYKPHEITTSCFPSFLAISLLCFISTFACLSVLPLLLSFRTFAPSKTGASAVATRTRVVHRKVADSALCSCWFDSSSLSRWTRAPVQYIHTYRVCISHARACSHTHTDDDENTYNIHYPHTHIACLDACT